MKKILLSLIAVVATASMSFACDNKTVNEASSQIKYGAWVDKGDHFDCETGTTICSIFVNGTSTVINTTTTLITSNSSGPLEYSVNMDGSNDPAEFETRYCTSMTVVVSGGVESYYAH